MPKQTNRKNEHVSLAEKFYDKPFRPPFEDVRFVHHSFPQMAVKDVDLSVSFEGMDFTVPFYINAMTGGSRWTGKVNEKLALVAREAGLAIATGSVSAAMKMPEVEDSYKIVREVNPNGLVFANLGAGHGLENAKRAVDLLKADALQIHVNAPQEVVMPEGDRDFTDWISNIEEIVNGLDRPVMVKEVGFGMSRETIRLLRSIGVSIIDISGTGGTDFAQIENYRRKEQKFDDLEGWGQSTAVSLLEAQEFLPEATLIASGGIREPMDIAKSLALGASLAGISSQVLHLVLQEGVDETITVIEGWKKELARILTLLQSRRPQDLQHTDLILSGDTRDWCDARGIDFRSFASRSTK